MPFLPALVLLAACNPMDAEVSGSFLAYLAKGSSENLTRLERGGETISERAGELGLAAVDCRDLSALEAEAQTAERLPGAEFETNCLDEAGDAKSLKYFTWLDDYAFWRKDGTFAPDGDVQAWRTEAVLTPEGDLQLTVHVDVEGIGDLRFGWSIDPDFAPTVCDDTEDGGAATRAVDGDWLAGWRASAEASGMTGQLWPLNAGGYQINPSNTGVYWYVPQEWMSGTAFARFEDEQFFSHPTDYADPDGVPLYQLMYAGPSYPTPRASGPEAYLTWAENTRIHLGSSAAQPAEEKGVTDFGDIGQSDFAPKFIVEDNAWRPADVAGTEGASGFDQWLGVMPGWVRIDNPEAIEVGSSTPVTGEFQIYLEGVAAASKILVKGSFSIANLREDVWGYDPLLEDTKREENGTPVCGSTEAIAAE